MWGEVRRKKNYNYLFIKNIEVCKKNKYEECEREKN